MLTWAHSRFCNRLILKIIIKMKHIQVKLHFYFYFNIYLLLCNYFEFIKYNLDGKSVFKCNKCEVIMNSDINGTWRIFFPSRKSKLIKWRNGFFFFLPN